MDTQQREFERIVKAHKSTIYTVCYMFSKDSDEVADLFQEVLINLWKGFPSFRADSGLRTWIYRVALNTCISSDRKQRRQRARHCELELDFDLFNDQDADTQQVKKLYDRISLLGPYDRAIIMLWLENMSYDEIGMVMGITAKNVSVRLYRIKEALKNMSNH
jgi:RNA polymerase sigma-70 factor (ECF subfamily)